ncbi:MAG: MBL fold metallo-hydrolase [Jatrophihabitans sp.]
MARFAGSEPYLQEIADGVFGYVQPLGGWCVSNAGVIANGGEVAIIDTLSTAGRARAMLDTVAGLDAGPVRTVVNTHFHGDHTFGNQFFDQATIIGHRLIRPEMLAAGLSLTMLWPDVEWGELQVTPPSVLFDDTMTLYVGDRQVELIHVGPAHTTNDVVAWLPEERVLFAGDVVLAGCTPFNLMGSVSGSLRAVQRLAELQPRTVLCGHGAVSGPEVFTETTDYLQWLDTIARAGRAAGLAPLELARQTDLGEFAGLLDSERIVGNLHRVYAELDGAAPGAILDVMTIFGEIIEFNGGRPPACAA